MNDGGKSKKTDPLKILGYGCGGCAGALLLVIFFFFFLSYLGSRSKERHNNAEKSTTKTAAATPTQEAKNNEIEEHNKKVLEEAMLKEREAQRKEKREAVLRERKVKAEEEKAREAKASKEKEATNGEYSVEYKLAVISAGTYIPEDHITVNRFRYLLGRICPVFKITKLKAGDMTVKCSQMLKEQMGIEETPLNIMEGMNKLISSKTKDQKYQDYLALYLALRNDGKTHEEAIEILQGSLKATGLY